MSWRCPYLRGWVAGRKDKRLSFGQQELRILVISLDEDSPLRMKAEAGSLYEIELSIQASLSCYRFWMR